ncbi:uncharacterized protein LOC122142540 [Cyprinus carpio]|uniref:Uncharacterized protein LOC122142540 n=1 Tax=Cyprinus carpio TaxID=7962 RepID=A0A9Q9XY04_CYPCA|nr:uncharacterized protein LOC122142540 [Cyprinus carpio]
MDHFKSVFKTRGNQLETTKNSLEFFTNKLLDLRGCGVLTESKTIKSRELDLALFTLAITLLPEVAENTFDQTAVMVWTLMWSNAFKQLLKMPTDLK